MHQLVVAVYDSKAEFFLPPFMCESKGAAIRAFGDAVNDAKCPVCAHPEDYTLFHLANFDRVSGRYDVLPANVSLCTAMEFVRHE